MGSKLSDLNNHLFAQLERLGDKDLKGEDLKNEVERATAVTQVSSEIIQNAKITLDAAKLIATGKITGTGLPHLIGMEKVKLMDN